MDRRRICSLVLCARRPHSRYFSQHDRGPRVESRGVPRTKLGGRDIFQPCDRHPTFRADLGVDENVFLLMYAGNLGPAQALDGVIRAVALLEETERISLVLVGEGVEQERLQSLADDLAPGRIHFVPTVPASEVPALMAAADVQLLSLRDEPVFRHTMPSKIQSILASGQPVIACAPGDAGAVAVDSGAGWHVQPGNPQHLADCILKAKAEGITGLQVRGGLAALHNRGCSWGLNPPVSSSDLAMVCRPRGYVDRFRESVL